MKSKNYFVFKQQNGTIDIYLYDDITADYRSWWTGDVVKSETSSKAVKELLEANPNATQINLHINSNGGDVKEGMGIYSLIKRHPAQKTAYIDGFAASIASVIAMSCDKVVMSSLALMFLHHASMCVYGNANELRKAAEDIEVIDGSSCKAYQNHAGDKLSDEKLKELLDGETWLNAEQCLELGLCDEVEEKTANTAKTVAEQMFRSYRQQIVSAAEQEQKNVIQQMAEKFSKN